MRLVSINDLSEGMILAKTIYGGNGDTLLNAGITFTGKLIERIQKLDFESVYIEDSFSTDVEIDDVINSDLRNETTKKIKNFFWSAAKMDEKSSVAFTKDVNQLILKIIDQVMDNRDLLIEMIDLKTYDDYTFQHSVNVGVLSAVIGVAVNLSNKELYDLASSALFHDIGKMFVPPEIINKPSSLTDEEFVEIQKHPNLGYEFASKYLKLPATVLNGILLHHEKCNGSGYPFKKKKAEISVFAKIIAICDVYDALTSDRCYRKALLPSEAIEYIMANSDEHFDAQIITAFLKKIAPYPSGLTVELSNGESGIVFKNNKDFLLRPTIKLFNSEENKQEERFIDLSDFKNASITIVNVLK